MEKIKRYIDEIMLIDGIIITKVTNKRKIEYVRQNMFIKGAPYTRKINNVLISSITNVNPDMYKIDGQIEDYNHKFNRLIYENYDIFTLYFKVVSKVIDSNILLTSIPELYFVTSILDKLNVNYSLNRVERANLRINSVSNNIKISNCELPFEPLRDFIVSGNRLYTRKLYKLLPTFKRGISLNKIPYSDKIIVRNKQKPTQLSNIRKIVMNICNNM